MAIVMVAYAAIQVPVALFRASSVHNPPSLEIVSMLLGTFFVTLNIPLSLPFARPLRERRHRWLLLALWMIGMVGLQFIAVMAQNALARIFWPGATPVTFAILLPNAIILDSATAVALLVAVIAIEAHEASVSAILRTERLRAEARQEEAEALLAQLHPHFLFNTLNAIAALIRIDPRAAKTTIEQLRTLIEQHIEAAPPIWTVGEEMHVVSTYLEIEKKRFGDQLQTELDVDSGMGEVPFPRLLLQPLVENAVRHGARRGGCVSVHVERNGDEVRATVRDPGFFDPSNTHGLGVGLSNVRARLELLYGEKQRLDIATTGNGTTVDLQLPIL